MVSLVGNGEGNTGFLDLFCWDPRKSSQKSGMLPLCWSKKGDKKIPAGTKRCTEHIPQGT